MKLCNAEKQRVGYWFRYSLLKWPFQVIRSDAGFVKNGMIILAKIAISRRRFHYTLSIRLNLLEFPDESYLAKTGESWCYIQWRRRDPSLRHFDTIPARDRQTDRQTNMQTDMPTTAITALFIYAMLICCKNDHWLLKIVMNDMWTVTVTSLRESAFRLTVQTYSTLIVGDQHKRTQSFRRGPALHHGV